MPLPIIPSSNTHTDIIKLPLLNQVPTTLLSLVTVFQLHIARKYYFPSSILASSPWMNVDLYILIHVLVQILPMFT